MPKRKAEDAPEAEEPEKDAEDAEEEPKVEKPKKSPPKKSPKKKAVAEEDENAEDEDDAMEEGEGEEDEAPLNLPLKKKAVTVTLKRIGGSLGLAMDGNHVTKVNPGGAAEKEGMLVNDVVTEVNGKDTSMDSFGSLLPKDKSAPIKLRIMRFVKDDSEKKKKKEPKEEEAKEEEAKEEEAKEEEAKEEEAQPAGRW